MATHPEHEDLESELESKRRSIASVQESIAQARRSALILLLLFRSSGAQPPPLPSCDDE
jgi:hypothetical protein